MVDQSGSDEVREYSLDQLHANKQVIQELFEEESETITGGGNGFAEFLTGAGVVVAGTQAFKGSGGKKAPTNQAASASLPARHGPASAGLVPAVL